MTSTGNSSSPIDGVYGSADPFPTEGNGTSNFIGSTAVNKFDFHTIKAANATNAKLSNRYDLTKNELLHMLCYLEGELQARDVVIAALRNDRIKQYIHALRAKRITLDDPQAALFRDKATITGNHVSRQSSAAAIQADFEVRSVVEQQIESLHQVIIRQRQTQGRIVAFLSDSLENNQRMRHELEEEKRKHEHDTAQGDDITYGLEMERTKLKQELETERTNRKKLEKDVKKAQELLEFERGRQKQIVLLLLAERKKIIMKYIEERKRSEDLAQILSEEKQRSDSIAEDLEEESKKSLRMEAELEKQTLAIENERKTWKINFAKEEKKIKDMEIELVQLRNENESYRKQLAIRMGGTSPVIVGSSGGVFSSKVRAGAPNTIVPGVSEDLAAVASSSIMNVAKIIQPTATVSSVPVSGPTTGIARSISPGQCLRQQAVTSGNELILASSPLASCHPSVNNSSFNPAKALGNSVTENLGGVAGAKVVFPATVTNLPTCLNQQQQQQQALTVHRSGGNSSVTASCATSSLAATAASPAIVSANANTARGVPPPIPPNKPTVPPKREASISRICTTPGPTATYSNNSVPIGPQTTASSVVANAALSNINSPVPSSVSNVIP